MIVPGVAFDLVWHIVIIASGVPKASGTIFCYVRRKSDGFWLKTDGTWTLNTTPPVGVDVPTAEHTKAGLWKLTLSNTTTNGLSGGEVLHAVAVDSETEATVTVMSDCVEETVHAIPLAPSTAGRTLDVSVGGEAGIDWANIGSPTTAQNLSGTNVGSVTGLTTLLIADAVWDEPRADHVGAGTTGEGISNLNDALLGEWQIFTGGPDANRLVLYRPSAAVLKKFDLFDSLGNPTTVEPYRRVPV